MEKKGKNAQKNKETLAGEKNKEFQKNKESKDREEEGRVQIGKPPRLKSPRLAALERKPLQFQHGNVRAKSWPTHVQVLVNF